MDSSGTFTATFETDQYKAATGYVRDLYTAGIFHPDSSNYNTISARDAFQAREFASHYDGLDMPWRNIVGPAPVAFLPVNAPEFPTLLQQWEGKLAPVGVEDASVGLVSRTYAQKGATANRVLGDGLSDIVTGRRPLSDYDGLVKDWLNAVGNTAKTEYQQAYAAAQSKS